jgi:hypothetical protein
MKGPTTQTLYFTAGAVATAAEIEKAELLSGNVVFRNASVVQDDDSIEESDYVAGSVPAPYDDVARQEEEEEEEEEEEVKEKDLTPKVTTFGSKV